MLEGSSSENSHVASIDDNEIYFIVAGGGNKKGNVYGLGALSKRFTTSTSAYSSTSQTPVVHQIEEMHETIQKLNVELMVKDAKERTLEEKMEHLMKNHEQQSERMGQQDEKMHQQHEQMKLILQHIQLKSPMPTTPSDPPSSDDSGPIL